LRDEPFVSEALQRLEAPRDILLGLREGHLAQRGRLWGTGHRNDRRRDEFTGLNRRGRGRR